MKRFLMTMTLIAGFAFATSHYQPVQADNFWGTKPDSGCHYYYPYNGWEHHCHHYDDLLLIIGGVALVGLAIALIVVAANNTQEQTVSFTEAASFAEGKSFDFGDGQLYFKPEMDVIDAEENKFGIRAGFKW